MYYIHVLLIYYTYVYLIYLCMYIYIHYICFIYIFNFYLCFLPPSLSPALDKYVLTFDSIFIFSSLFEYFCCIKSEKKMTLFYKIT